MSRRNFYVERNNDVTTTNVEKKHDVTADDVGASLWFCTKIKHNELNY
jgi:hypothetical protein